MKSYIYMCNKKIDIRLSEYLKLIGVKEEQLANISKTKVVNFNEKFCNCTLEICRQKLAYKISDSFYGYFIKKDNEGYHVGCTLPNEANFFNDEYDRCSDAIELYSKVYGKAISLDKDIIKFEFQDNKNIIVSGDIDFNFKMKHIRYFEDIIEKGKSEMGETQKSKLKLRLLSYHDLTYNPDNISLLPKTGALNNIKKQLGNERLDTFLFALELYYEKGITSFILSGAGGLNPPFIVNRNELIEFLDSFKSINDYCKQIYHIDKELVKNLCSSGSKPIDTPERVEEYLNLATKFWEQKKDFYDEKSNIEIKNQYQKMMDEIIDIREAREKKYTNTFTETEDVYCIKTTEQ